jgi:hypothetical protein
MKFLSTLLHVIENISVQLKENNKTQKEILDSMNLKIADLNSLIYSWAWGTIWWSNIISDNFIEDSRDKWVMIKKEKAIKIIFIDYKWERTEKYTRFESLTKSEKEYYEKWWVILITP